MNEGVINGLHHPSARFLLAAGPGRSPHALNTLVLFGHVAKVVHSSGNCVDVWVRLIEVRNDRSCQECATRTFNLLVLAQPVRQDDATMALPVPCKYERFNGQVDPSNWFRIQGKA